MISITDGQIYLQPDLFFAGSGRPWTPASRFARRRRGADSGHEKVAGGLRLDLAAFRELEAFAQLGTDLDPQTQARLDRGYRMVELLKQAQYQPMDVFDEVLSIYAGTRGYLDKIAASRLRAWETRVPEFHARATPEIVDKMTRPRSSRTSNGRRAGRGDCRVQPEFQG